MKSKNGRKYTICLNMIVKNEAHCITGTFDNLLSFITFDYYVISDTGSTDGTQDVIRNYFKAKNIPGEIFQHEWKNFGFNRSKALEVAYNKTDALMIFDADDRLHGDFNLPDEIRADSYLLHFGSDVGYARPLLINNRKRFCFKGVLHEFLCPIGEGFSQTTLPGKYYVECGHSGSRSKDPEKYLKDARILEKAFEEENDRGLTNRYAFYCAQSYKDYGPTTHKDAIRWYKKVLELETWNQEKYYSCMMLGELCHMQGDDINSLKYFIKSIEYDRERIEGIAQATEYFRKKEFHVLVNLLYNKYKDYDKNPKDKLFINKILYNDFIEFNNSISAYYIDDKQSGYECCKKIFTNNIVDGQRLNNTFQNFKYYQNQVHHDKDISNYFQLVDDLICKRNEELGKDAYDVWNILFNKEKENLTKYREQFFKNKQKNPYVMITFTTCKRFDLFQQTMNSILNTWQDISKIDYWFCVDDNSSKEDRKLMKDKYPWIDYYLKNDEEKGHRKSMNIIWDKLKKLKPKYWIHMEDDFLFHKKMNYITDSVKYLNELKDKNVAQILFNRNYGEVIEDYKLMSHAKYNDEVVIQDYKDGYFGYANCHYWPNYSFRPSIVVTDVILKLGNFDSDNQFFEMDYAKRFTNEGYKSAFFNRICCKHIGRLTSERNDKSKPNAYELNNENQFSSEPVKSNVKVINLKRRTDRREKIVKVLKDANIKNYEIVEGVDGKTLIPTRNICKMFRGNDFGSRRGVIGCAITHYNLWISLLNDKENDYYMVIEDDMTVCDKFKEVVEKLENQFKEKEMLLLGYHMMTDVRERVKDIYDNGDFDNIKVDKLDMSLYLGGIHCYTINKKGAEKLVKFIAENGIKHGIDYIFKAYNILECWETRPLVAYADWNENGKQIDTDIQNLYESFNLNITERELLDKYECYYNQDFIGNDICYRNATDLFDMLMIAENTEGCVSFNTLGYFKNSMVVEKLSPLDNCNFYVKKSFLKNNKIIAFLYDDERILYFVRANQEVLGNKSIVLFDKKIKFEKLDGFESIGFESNDEIDTILKSNNVSYFYQLKYGNNNGILSNVCKNLIHVTDNCSEPHGDVYASISENTKNNDGKYPVVPFGDINVFNEVFIHGKFEKKEDNEFVFVLGMDQSDYDLYYHGGKSVEEYLEIAKKDKNCVAFNTLGFFKNNIILLKPSPYFSEKDGIYIRKDVYEKYLKSDKKNYTADFEEVTLFENIRNSTKNYCIMHSCTLKDTLILEQLITLIVNTGLISHLEYIFIFNIGLTVKNTKNDKIKIINLGSDTSVYENPTINLMHSFAERNPDSKILYLHTKGASYGKTLENIEDWKNMMLYFLVEKYKDCLKLLEKYDTVGCNYMPEPHPHFSGNFWWANSKHIKNLKKITNKDRYEAEWWIFSDNPNINYYCLHHSQTNHYHHLYPRELYAKEENNKIRVKMMCNWCSSYQLCKEWSNMCEEGFRWKDIEITWENHNIDYWVIVNRPSDNSYFDPKRTIIFQMEPWVLKEEHLWGVKTWGEWAEPDEKNFLAVRGRKQNIYNNAFWQLELTAPELEKLTYSNKKDKIASICSSKYYDEGHIARIDFLKFLEQKNDIEIDIFNADNQHQFKNYRGPLTPYVDKSKGIIPYKYYFMVENNYERNFITEKIWEPILCETLVFYYGCPNVADYINPEAYVQLDMNDFEKSYQIIKQAISQDWWSKRLPIIRQEKKKILEELAFFPVINKIIQKNEPDWIENITSAWKGHRIFVEWLVNEINPDVVVDLGVDFGYSTFVFAKSLMEKNNGIVYGIDLFEGDEQTGERNTFINVLNNIKNNELTNIQIIKGDFTEISKSWSKKIDILHIDGYHTYEAVKNDYNNWARFVKEDGIILFHDVAILDYGVKDFFKEIVGSYKLHFKHSAGLGICTKNKDLYEKILKKFDNVFSNI